MSQQTILRINDLHIIFDLGNSSVKAVDGVNFEILEGETIGIIGESGSGKSILGLSILRLLPSNAKIKGETWFADKNLTYYSEEDMRKIRGKEIAWIPQNPSASFNPVLKIGFQIAEPMVLHMSLDKIQARKKVVELLQLFGIQPAEERVDQYPYQYSGGMRQRAMVAMGTSTKPKLLIADEPTKGLDNFRKKQVAFMFRKVKDDNKDLSILLITHDLSFAQALCDRIAVMYCGQIIEINLSEMFFKEPLHPYGKALLESLPARGMKSIPGEIPSMINPPSGCRFHPRCKEAMDKCKDMEPPLLKINGSMVRCWHYA
ncbi:ABC transporter ATP-binding protein [Aceticella autotrophica]|uniref:Nickel import system ATP-binding protein NikD n=1 Tax=Aceticella autotrophica TaxID=2755338 RepID=A0A975GA57_9THEO|nr:ABC transporter ATP-binding protein [Aceticella autotrophica]QSZ26779.1 ABC transporter ATP-binding protein [Aceticella autotrophica]QSZ27083.1 ABC transporter ATP-binding protein [Aceticella autotrophica]